MDKINDKLKELAQDYKFDKKKVQEKILSLKKRIKDLETEYNGFKWIIKAGLDEDNCKFDTNKNVFRFGYWNSFKDNKAEMKERLKNFPYSYNIE